MTTSIAVKEQRKRDFSALGLALLIHLFVVGGYLLSDYLFIADVVDYSGPILVKLGQIDAPQEVTDSLPATPVEKVEEPKVPDEGSTVTDEVKKNGVVGETVKPDESQREKVNKVPVKEAGVNGDSEQTITSSSSESAMETADAPPAEVEKVVNVTSGEEEGNSYETTFEATQGVVGRSLGAPIYFYLPLPQTISQDIFDSLKDDPDLETRTADKKKGILNLYYEEKIGKFFLKKQQQPPFPKRPELWAILAEGGYDVHNYKNVDYYLKGREIVFTFVVQVGEDSTELTDVKFVRRSGYSEIDESVVYGFMQASFYNSAETPVKGRFTYRFE